MPPKSKEKPVIADYSDRNEAVLKDQRECQGKNPYSEDNPERQKALQYIRDRKIKIRPLRQSDD